MRAPLDVPHYRLTVDRFHQMIEAGIFGPEDKVELIEGELIAMVPPGPEHADYVTYLDRKLTLISSLHVRAQNPITLPDHSEPEPDIALVTPKRYRGHHPLPDDVKLIIEVSDKSLKKDKQLKLPLYARYQIPEVWILDVAARAIECYWDPRDGHYAQSRGVTTGILIAATLPQIEIDLDALWD